MEALTRPLTLSSASACPARRANAQLQRTVARVGDECSARDEDVSALLAQLRSAEQAAAAAAGEAAALRAQLAQVEGLLAARDEECAALKGQLNSTVARCVWGWRGWSRGGPEGVGWSG